MFHEIKNLKIFIQWIFYFNIKIFYNKIFLHYQIGFDFCHSEINYFIKLSFMVVYFELPMVCSMIIILNNFMKIFLKFKN